MAAKAATAVIAEATEKPAEKGNHAVWPDHIAENQKMEKQAVTTITTEGAAGAPTIAGGAAVGLVGATGVGKAMQH